MAPASISPPVPLDLAGRADDAATTADAEATVLRLFDAHAVSLRRYVCHCGLSPDAAEDVVQDAFVALFRHLQGGGNTDNLPGWLVQVCFRQALKARHRTARRSVQERSLEDGAYDVADSEMSIESRLLTRHRQRWVAAVVQALPERDRQCVSMRAEGVTYRTIAQELGMSLGGVAKAIARAAARLSRGIKE